MNAIPVNPQVLRWARETSGLSVEEVAHNLNRKSITAETVAAWERGEGSPNYPQLETLAYKIYKRPLSLFFFPEPPLEKTLKQAFRTLPEPEIQRLSPRLRYLLRQAQSMQLNLAELYDGVNPTKHQIVRDLKFAPDASISEMATKVRQYLNVALSDQLQWKSAEDAFKTWRNALEDCGVFVFKEAFKDDVASGFCLYDDRFPVIYVNNSKPDTRQIFTLFHELAHLLSGTGGVDTPLEGYVNFLQGDDKRIEVLCNSFAGAFLVPDEDFDRRIATVSINDRTIGDLANQYWVSREVILRKFYDRRLVSQQFYEHKVEKWRKEAKDKTGKGGDYYLTKGVYLGERYLELVFSRLHQNRISIEQLADYLGVKVKNVPGMEALLLRKGDTA
jgi:Zn-dependent peptidase ImmA (M78 family)